MNASATLSPDGNVENLSTDAWRNALDVNFTGVFLMCNMSWGISAPQAAAQSSTLRRAMGTSACGSLGLLLDESRAHAFHARPGNRLRPAQYPRQHHLSRDPSTRRARFAGSARARTRTRCADAGRFLAAQARSKKSLQRRSFSRRMKPRSSRARTFWWTADKRRSRARRFRTFTRARPESRKSRGTSVAEQGSNEISPAWTNRSRGFGNCIWNRRQRRPDDHCPEADRFRTFERALSIGINYFDTSPDYGKGRAEENLGSALKRFGREAGRALCLVQNRDHARRC